MSSTASRLRAELQAETGVDFATYADDELMDAVTGWSGLVGLAFDLLVAVGIGAATLVVSVIGAGAMGLEAEAPIGVVVAGFVAGAGLAALVFALRARRRAPAEVTKVFDLAGVMVERVADDVATGKLSVGVGDAARGLAIVAAVPALTRVAQRRFPLVGTLAAPATGALLARVLSRVWPTGGGQPLTGIEGPARSLRQALDSARGTIVPKLATAVRWATFPLLVGGVTLVAIGIVVGFVSVVTA